MDKQSKPRWKRDIVTVLIYFLLLSGIVFLKWINNNYLEDNVHVLKDGWIWERSDGIGVPVTAGTKVAVKKGETLTIKNKIPKDIKNGMDLCFWSSMESVRVWAGGELLYEYGMEGDEDRVWNNIYIPPSKAGQELIIEKNCSYTVYTGQINKVYWGEYSKVQKTLMRLYFPDYVFGLILMVIGCFTIFIALFLKGSSYSMYQGIYLGIFTFVISVWICGESRLPVEYMSINSMKVSCGALICAPIAYLLYIRERTEGRYRLGYRVVLAVACINAAVNFILAGVGVTDMVQMLPITHVVLLLVIGFVSYAWCREWRKRNQKVLRSKLHVMKLLGTVGMVLSTITECVIFYVDQDNSTGTYVQGALLLYICIVSNAYFIDSLEREKEREMLTLQLEESRMKMMLSQIKPHFLYNTLLAIQELCYTMPEKAADTIVTFADYLRNNMNFMAEVPLIPFQKELRHVQNYMDIQQVRFGRELDFVEDIRCMDFMIPPLSVQPIVENAVQHGVRGCPGGGVVKLTTEMRDGWVYIITDDNGVGFDVNKGRKHPGFSALENVQKRIHELLDGEMSVESEIGCGTRITIKFPYREEESYEGNRS